MAINVGTVTVSVVPDATGFGEKLRAAVRDASVTVKVELDSAQAEARLDELSRGGTVRMDVDLDAEAAEARLDELSEGGSVRMDVDLDDKDAEARLEELTHPRDVTVNVDLDAGGAEGRLAALGAEAGAASGGMGALASAALILGPALVPIGAAATAGLGAILPLALAGAGGLGVLALAFSGVSNAVKLLGTQQKDQAAAAITGGQNQVAAQAAIANAQRQAVSAQMSLGDARRSAAQQQITDTQAVAAAQQTLTDANGRLELAQRALTDAQEAGRRELEDYANNAADAALSQEQARISLEKAQQALAALNSSGKGTDLQKRQAVLDVAKAQQTLTEANQAAAESAKDNTDAQAKGLAGTPAVVRAAQDVKSAQEEQQKATQTLANAQAKAAADQITSAESIQRANMSVAAAADALAQAQEQANGKTSSGLAAVNAQIAALDPAVRSFAEYIRSTVKPAFKDLQAAAAGGLLPGFQRAIEDIMPMMPGLTGFVGGLAKTMGDLADQAGKALAGPFWQDFFHLVGQTAGPLLADLVHSLGNVIEGFAGIIKAFLPMSSTVGGGLVDMTDRFSKWGQNLSESKGFHDFIAYVKESWPSVKSFFSGLGDFIGVLINVGKVLGPIIGDAIGKIGSVLKEIPTKVLVDLAGGLIAVVGGMKLLSAFKSIGSIFGAVGEMGPWGLALLAIAGAFILVYTNSKTFRDFISYQVVPTLKEWWTWIKDNLVPVLQDLWTWIKDKLVPVLAGIFMDAWHGITEAVHIVSDAVNKHSDTLKEFWNKVLSPLINFIVEKLLPLIGPIIRDAFKDAGKVISGIIDVVSDTLKFIMDVVDIFKDAFKGKWGAVWDDMKRAFGDAWNALKDLAKIPIEFIINTVINDGIIAAINDVISLFGGGKPIKDIKDPFADMGKAAVASGTSGGRARTLATGGVLEGYSPGVDSVHTLLSPGEGVLVPETVRALGGAPAILALNSAFSSRVPGPGLGPMQSFAGGGIVGKVKDVAGWIAHPMDKLKDIVQGLVGDVGKSPLGQMALSGVDMLIGKAVDFVKGLVGMGSGGGGGGTAGSAGGAGRWKGTVDQVLALLGQPLSLDAGVLSLINSESGGNPNAINLTDSNARAGHPSQGLMQTIPATFARYAGPYAGLGITNPMANIYAGVNYALQNYGPGMLAAGGRHSGGKYIGYDSGGILPPGPSMVYNGTGTNELVVPPSRTFDQVMGGGAGGKSQFTGNLYLDSGEFLGVVRGVAESTTAAGIDSMRQAVNY